MPENKTGQAPVRQRPQRRQAENQPAASDVSERKSEQASVQKTRQTTATPRPHRYRLASTIEKTGGRVWQAVGMMGCLNHIVRDFQAKRFLGKKAQAGCLRARGGTKRAPHGVATKLPNLAPTVRGAASKMFRAGFDGSAAMTHAAQYTAHA